MTTGYTEFTDDTGADSPADPIVRGGLIGAYLTGKGIVPWTAAQIAARLAAGEGVVGIDQTPGGQLFAQNALVDGVRAAVYDVESLAGTPASAAAACRQRAAAGVRQHTLYVSLAGLPALRAAVAGIPGVVYGVADYSMSLAAAEAYIAANPDVVYVQFGDPGSNPDTDVPGTTVTLSQANADIDVARASWAAQFMPPQPPATPAPSTDEETIMQLKTTGEVVPLRFPVFPAYVFLFADFLGQTVTSVSIRVALHKAAGGWDLQPVTLTPDTPGHTLALPPSTYDAASFVREGDGPNVAVSWR